MSVCHAEVRSSRVETSLKDGWRFHRGEADGAFMPAYDDSGWDKVSVPHDWAITGPFSIENDLQNVQIVQNMETKASLKTGRTGGLPYVGIGWYRTEFSVPDGMTAELLFDGAMSEARVYVNGHEVCFWPYGYSPFHCDVTPYLNKSGSNVLAVRLENLPFSSRWYPGAGLYRNVHLVCTSAKAHIPVWGTFISTPSVHKDMASVSLAISLQSDKENIDIEYYTDIISPEGEKVASRRSVALYHKGDSHVQKFLVKEPKLWSPEHPHLYKALTRILVDGVVTDEYETRFGIRSIEFIPEKGFYLNGEHRKFKGVCNHHDLGPLGAAVSVPALRHQLTMLKDMGCDAVRTSHNTPAPELVSLCDEMGFMMMVEPFDEWNDAKCENGYHRYFDEWAERDMISMLHAFRNSPSVIMWSIGNEVPSQCTADGYKTAAFLQSICHREDPTRPATCGMDQVNCVLSNGFAAQLDIPGINYRTFRYKDCYEQLPQGLVLGSETTSTVSSRGTYHFPVEKAFSVKHEDHQSSGYDMEACNWSNIPDVDLALAEDYPWTLGQFVWTGFDYLGEPSPYDTDAWPNHSSMFGIIDLASIPKDRYWLYRSIWNTESPTLHIVPHWTWPGREGKVTPVYVYTSWPEAELFVNGVSQGRRSKLSPSAPCEGLQDEALEGRYRLMWNDVVYQKGEIRVVAYDAKGNVAASESVRTAGKPYALRLECDRSSIARDGEDLAYVTVSVTDKDGNTVPTDTREVLASVSGAGEFRAIANGDPCSLEMFHHPRMHLFAGKLTVIVRSKANAEGPILLKVNTKGLRSAELVL
uniref:glycoside hydrolase family 2 TIM barrel-domain containing protein n=1 Tax=Candidatus Cryptobacteroides bacterium TaxID=3085639 RepID=UPI00402A2D90